jgi:hypothetical protein
MEAFSLVWHICGLKTLMNAYSCLTFVTERRVGTLAEPTSFMMSFIAILRSHLGKKIEKKKKKKRRKEENFSLPNLIN